MTIPEILAYRLKNQQIVETRFSKPEEIVSWLVAMQAQEFPMAKWAIGLRLPGLKESDVDRAFNDGAILRTHVMRPTWHFVCPADIRWLLALTAPRVHTLSSTMYRRLELDSKVFKRCNDLLVKLLEGGRHLDRNAIKSELEKEMITTNTQRLVYILMQAELEGLICSGPRQGKQFTYALLEERVPPAPSLTRDEALAQLSLRYFRSRGPATAYDFSWWSGLTVRDAREGINSLPPQFVRETIDGNDYVFAPGDTEIRDPSRMTFLLPDYDEYGISYKDRSAIGNKSDIQTLIQVDYQLIMVEGRYGGTWRRKENKDSLTIETELKPPFEKTKQKEISLAVERYCSFFEKNSSSKNNE